MYTFSVMMQLISSYQNYYIIIDVFKFPTHMHIHNASYELAICTFELFYFPVGCKDLDSTSFNYSAFSQAPGTDFVQSQY